MCQLHPLKIGSMFSGYGGLDLAAEHFFQARVAWLCEFDKDASKVLAQNYPGIPNLGDVSKVDWSKVEPVDIITGGSPCQDLSIAGGRLGMSGASRSNSWVAMREAIEELKPQFVLWENVRGAFTAHAESTSDLEQGEGQVGETNLRALGRVLGDLSELGYDAQWGTVYATDSGACHQRSRVFVLATLANADSF